MATAPDGPQIRGLMSSASRASPRSQASRDRPVIASAIALEVGRGLPAGAGQHGGQPEPTQGRHRGGTGDRGEQHGPFGQNLDQNACRR